MCVPGNGFSRLKSLMMPDRFVKKISEAMKMKNCSTSAFPDNATNLFTATSNALATVPRQTHVARFCSGMSHAGFSSYACLFCARRKSIL
jgi:hypothetical protein